MNLSDAPKAEKMAQAILNLSFGLEQVHILRYFYWMFWRLLIKWWQLWTYHQQHWINLNMKIGSLNSTHLWFIYDHWVNVLYLLTDFSYFAVKKKTTISYLCISMRNGQVRISCKSILGTDQINRVIRSIAMERDTVPYTRHIFRFGKYTCMPILLHVEIQLCICIIFDVMSRHHDITHFSRENTRYFFLLQCNANWWPMEISYKITLCNTSLYSCETSM